MKTAQTVAGLDAPIRIDRDAWGIAHLRARTTSDAWFGLGYLHAVDRLWQMDASRRRMIGRWSEWVGAEGIAADRLARQLGGEPASRRDLAVLGPAARSMLSAYTAGVNARLDQVRREGLPLPLEYRLLGETPEPWQDWHAIAAMRNRGFLMGSVWFKLWRAAAVRAIGPDAVNALRYHDGGRDRLVMPPGADTQRWVASLAELEPAIDALAALGAADATGGGSNNWAVSGSRTASGRPLLAGDPHRVFEMPGMYHQAHVACDRFDVIGLTVPGVPGFPHFGHNGRVAWSVTHAFADIHDLFVERFADEGRRVLTADGWQDCTVRDETIRVRDADPVTVRIIETGHGPVVAGDPAAGSGLALQSMQFAVTDRSFDCLPAMLEADSVQTLFEATRGWGLIDHNLVAADTAGSIGHRVRAIVPDRPRLNGWLPVPGWTGEYDWRGMIAWEAMPQTIDPPRGFLVTANNRFIDEQPGDRHYFSTDCHPSWRAERIEARLDALPAATAADMAEIHLDDVSLAAPLFRDRLASLTPADLAARLPAARASAARGLLAAILAWDGRMAPDSTGATAYSRWRWALAVRIRERAGLTRTANDALMRVPPGVIATHQLWWALPAMVLADDRRLLGLDADGSPADWPTVFLEALDAAATDGEARPWGPQHPVRMAHPLAGRFKQAAHLLQPAGLPSGGDNETVWANGCLPGDRPHAGTLGSVYGSIARYVFDVGHWDASGWVVFDGVAGDPEDPHYVDQHPEWAAGRLIPMHYDWSVITAAHDDAAPLPSDGEPAV